MKTAISQRYRSEKQKQKKADKTLKALLNKKTMKSKPLLSESAEQMQWSEKFNTNQAAQESLAETKSDPGYDPNAPNKNKKKTKK